MSKKPAETAKPPHPQTQNIMQAIRTVSDRLATAANSGQLKPAMKRQLKPVDAAIASLEKALQAGQLNDSHVAEQLIQMVNGFHANNFAAAASIIKNLYKTDFHQHKSWLKGMQSLTRVASATFR